MKNFLRNFIKNKILLTITALIIFLGAVVLMYKLLAQTLLYVEFDNLRPFHEKAPVYFRGYKIGKIIKIKPSEDYKNTLVTIILHPTNLKLPRNTTAHLKIHKTKWLHRDYLDLIYPQNPDSQLLQRGMKIKGKSSIDIHSYLANIPHESYEKMEENAAGILENLNDTTGMLYSVFAIINGILTEAEPDIKNSISNFSQTTKSTSQMMHKIDNSISETQLKNTFNNIYDTTSNAKTTISNLDIPISNIEKTMINVNCLLSNINEIVCGVKYTLRKRFSGIRLLFGKVID